MAISSSNSGGAWDNAKKYIEAKKLSTDKEEYNKVIELKKQCAHGYFKTPQISLGTLLQKIY